MRERRWHDGPFRRFGGAFGAAATASGRGDLELEGSPDTLLVSELDGQSEEVVMLGTQEVDGDHTSKTFACNNG